MAGPQLVGRPENAVLSTSTALVPAPPRPAAIVHDVNGYYRRLGVPPTATKREIREAYQDLDGQSSVELTRIFKTLINPKLRAAYDAKQPGSTYFDAAAVETILRQAAVQAAQQNAAYGTETTARDILETLAERTGKPLFEFLASGSGEGFDDDQERGRHPSPNPPATGPYSYLLVGSTCDDVDRLIQWQAGLAPALADRGCRHFLVGFHATTDKPFLVSRIQGAPVFLLHEEAQVTGDLIAAAATAVIA
jgi:hypothetical protein